MMNIIWKINLENFQNHRVLKAPQILIIKATYHIAKSISIRYTEQTKQMTVSTAVSIRLISYIISKLFKKQISLL